MAKHIQIRPGEALHYMPASAFHPANTYFHFSFADYYNPERMGFGALRVLNDDEVRPYQGFGRHPHRDMEIVSYIVSGHLTHWDSATNSEEVLGRGSVQTISAGSGVWHSELNQHEEWCRLLQIWILPPARGLPVRYQHHEFSPGARENRLLHIVGNQSQRGSAPLWLHQGVNLYVTELTDADQAVTFTVEEGRQLYLINIEGCAEIRGVATLQARDSAEITGPAELTLSCTRQQSAHLMLIEMAQL